MGTVFCDNCGVSLLEETAKFCRACGKPTPSQSEASTQRFDQRPGFQTATPTSPVGPSPTMPAYMAPFDSSSAAQTLDLKQKRKRNLILVASMLAVLIFALGGLLIFLSFADGTPTATISIPNAPVAPTQPPTGLTPPPAPPAPPAPPLIETTTNIESLVYPRSQRVMTTIGEGGHGVLQLHSDDPASKVVEWYLSKLKVSKKVSIAGQTVLKSGNTGVVIMGDDSGAVIVITQGGKDSED